MTAASRRERLPKWAQQELARKDDALDALVTSGYETILAANGMIRYVQDEEWHGNEQGAGAVLAYDRWRIKLASAVDVGRNLIRERVKS